MMVEIARTTYEKVDIIDALKGMISWAFDIHTGAFAEEYFLAEADDVFIALMQQILNSNGDLELRTLAYLECSQLGDNPRRHEVLAFVKANESRLIDYEDVVDFE